MLRVRRVAEKEEQKKPFELLVKETVGAGRKGQAATRQPLRRSQVGQVRAFYANKRFLR